MRRSLLGSMVLLLLLAPVGKVSACINDREVGVTEREFKSDYQGPPGSDSASSEEESSPFDGRLVAPLVASVAGSVMLGAAAVICLVKRGDRS